MRKLIVLAALVLGTLAFTSQPADCVLCGGWSCLTTANCSKGCACISERFGVPGVCLEAL